MYKDLAFAFFALLCMVLAIEAIRGLKHERVLGLFMMLVYIIGLGYFTMYRGKRTDLGGISFKLPIPFLKSLLNGKYSSVANRSVLNMLLFVPLGCLLPYNMSLWKSNVINSKLGLKNTIIIGFLVSLIIESCQVIFTVGVFELDDLVKNTMGTGIGYIVFLILCRRYGNSL